MRARQTIRVANVVSEVNRMLRESTCNAEVRRGMIAVLENILHETGNYEGFGYLFYDEVPRGELPGIHPMAQGMTVADRFANTDNTRVEYNRPRRRR